MLAVCWASAGEYRLSIGPILASTGPVCNQHRMLVLLMCMMQMNYVRWRVNLSYERQHMWNSSQLNLLLMSTLIPHITTDDSEQQHHLRQRQKTPTLLLGSNVSHSWLTWIASISDVAHLSVECAKRTSWWGDELSASTMGQCFQNICI